MDTSKSLDGVVDILLEGLFPFKEDNGGVSMRAFRKRLKFEGNVFLQNKAFLHDVRSERCSFTRLWRFRISNLNTFFLKVGGYHRFNGFSFCSVLSRESLGRFPDPGVRENFLQQMRSHMVGGSAMLSPPDSPHTSNVHDDSASSLEDSCRDLPHHQQPKLQQHQPHLVSDPSVFPTINLA